MAALLKSSIDHPRGAQDGAMLKSSIDHPRGAQDGAMLKSSIDHPRGAQDGAMLKSSIAVSSVAFLMQQYASQLQLYASCMPCSRSICRSQLKLRCDR